MAPGPIIVAPRAAERAAGAGGGQSAIKETSPKVTAPRLPPVHSRPRLMAVLDAATQAGRSVWIDAPPGAGKTTLVLDWLRARKRPAIFYRVDAEDNDLATLCYYLSVATAGVFESDSPALPAFTPDYLGGFETFTRRFFEVLSQRLPHDVVFVFDDLHEVGEQGELHQTLRTLIEQLGPQQNAVFVSRQAPPMAFARLRAHGHLVSLGWPEVRLTLDEAHAIAKLRGAPATTSVEQIHRATGGWIAGLMLMLEAPMPEGPVHFEDHLAQSLFDYFAGEVFSRLDEPARHLLLRTAFVPEVSTEAARQLSGQPAAEEILRDLVRRNYFTALRPGDAPRFEYHALFSSFLRASAASTLEAEELRSIKARSAKILTRERSFEGAAALYRELEAFDDLAQLIREEAETLVAQGRYSVLNEWLDALPQELVADDPWLTYWRGTLHLSFAPAQSEPLFSRAYEEFRARHDARGVFLAWCGVVDAFLFTQLTIEGLPHWVERLDRDLTEHGAALSDPELEGRVACGAVWALFLVDDQRALAWADRGFEAWSRLGSLPVRLRLGAGLIYVYCVSGNLPRAQTIAETHRRLVGEGDAPPGAALFASITECLVLSLTCQHAKVDEALRRARALIEPRGMHFFELPLYGNALYSLLTRRELAASDALLDAMLKSLGAQTASLRGPFYHAQAAWRRRLEGDTVGAIQHAREALAVAKQVHSGTLELMAHLALAAAGLDHGDAELARAHADLACAMAERSEKITFMAWALLARARIAFAHESEAAAHEFLRRGIEHQERAQALLLIYWLPEHASQIYARALERGIRPDFVRKVIRRSQLLPTDPRAQLETWPFPVKVYTLGRFAILIDDEPLVFHSKAQKKPIELLKALIAFGGRNVREQKLTDALWPDAVGAAAAHALTSTLHRLRKLIGDDAIRREDGLLGLDPRRVWVDAWQFEQKLAAIVTSSKSAAKESLGALADQLCALDRGTFLRDDSSQPWTLAARQRLTAPFLRALQSFGEALTQSEHFNEGAKCFAKALEIEPDSEATYQGLIRLWITQGDAASARATYELCRQMLAARDGSEPSLATERLIPEIDRLEPLG